MKAIVCELCGGNELIKQDDYFVCQFCGTKYTVEQARKMMIEGTVDVTGSTVKVDNTAELKNLYELARRAKNDNNSENAQKYYGEILIKDPSSWEANFYATYYQSMNCKIGGIGVAAVRISNCEDTVFNLIREHVTDSAEQRKAVDEVAAKLISISKMLFEAYKNHYDGISIQIKSNYTQEFINNCASCRDIVYNGGNWIVKIFGDEYGEIAADCWKLGVSQHRTLLWYLADQQGNSDVIKKYDEKILKYDSSYKIPETPTSSGGGGCYVATAVYGSYDCPQVWTLRRFRDYTLAETWYGRTFIKIYYTISPTLVKWFGGKTWFKTICKGKLDMMIARLNTQGVEATPYNDKIW